MFVLGKGVKSDEAMEWSGGSAVDDGGCEADVTKTSFKHRFLNTHSSVFITSSPTIYFI